MAEWPTFLPHELVRRYLEMYAEHFDLVRHIKFGRKVLSVLPILAPVLRHGIPALESEGKGEGELRHTGQWRITYQRASLAATPRSGSSSPTDTNTATSRAAGPSKTMVFDHVIVANGHHWKPNPPTFPGLDDFAGTKLHSHRYKMPYAFKDQAVLIIGAGNSGLDISTELSHHAAKVFLSTRTGAWVFPRATLFGLPTDFLNSRAFSALPRALVNVILESLVSLYHGALPAYGLHPQHRVLQAAPAINGEIFARISSGKVVVKPNVEHFGGHRSVTFQDGSVEEVDTVIYCTGYAIEHPFLDPQVLGQGKPGDRLQLYKHVFSLAYQNIAFVGRRCPWRILGRVWLRHSLTPTPLPHRNLVPIHLLLPSGATVWLHPPGCRDAESVGGSGVCRRLHPPRRIKDAGCGRCDVGHTHSPLPPARAPHPPSGLCHVPG
jgi:dimethylaniline monooxygenase (N-oxide forming)